MKRTKQMHEEVDKELLENANQEEELSVEEKIKATGYIDLSKANDTRIIVLLSLVFVVIIFLLSVFFPAPKEEKQEESTTESQALDVDYDTGFAKVEGEVYYYPHGIYNGAYKGFYEVGGNTYYFDEEGKQVTGWCKIEGKDYFFGKTVF